MDRQNRDSRQNSQHNHQTNGARSQNDGTNPARETTDINAESPEYYQIFLEQLLGLVSTGSQETVARLISIIQSGASQQEIFAALSEFREGHSDPGNKRQIP